MSSFFHTSPTAEDGSLAILHLKRDALQPVTLKSHAPEDGYPEGYAVTNTRFGSFLYDMSGVGGHCAEFRFLASS